MHCFRPIGLRALIPLAIAGLGGCDARLQPSPAALEQNRVAALTQRLADARELENLVGRVVRTPAVEASGLAALFALDEADVAIETPGEARAVGRQAVTQRVATPLPAPVAANELPVAIIEVANDALTAQALWGRLGVDFKKVGGQWKIWHWRLHAPGAAPALPKPHTTWSEVQGY